MSRKTLCIIFGIIALIVGISAFYLGRLTSYNSGYFEGAIFGDSSGYKRGVNIGFEEGYAFRDSIAIKEQSRQSSEQLNLNLIYEETGYPANYINVSGEVLSKEVGSSYFANNYETYVKLTVSNKARFARYKDIVVALTFKGKGNKTLGTLNYEVNEILYPGKLKKIEIPYDKVPRTTESVECKLVKATAID